MTSKWLAKLFKGKVCKLKKKYAIKKIKEKNVYI